MRLYLLGIALLAASAGAQPQQIQSGSGIGANTGGSSSINIPPPPAPPSTGTSADAAGTGGTSPRTETSVGASGITPDNVGRSSGRCDTLIGEERNKCLREHASTGTTGPASTGMGSGAGR
jgi:hypothetical protein